MICAAFGWPLANNVKDHVSIALLGHPLKNAKATLWLHITCAHTFFQILWNRNQEVIVSLSKFKMKKKKKMVR